MGHVLATAGHVDHGKSTLVRSLTGTDPDRWAEEKRRGLTLDLGFAWTTLGDETVAFVDVPGHERFVPTMLAGVGPVPAVVFVVAADGGWMPQSAEHLAALAALDVRNGLLVITRSDLADPTPTTRQAQGELARTSLAGIAAVSVSATTGAGIDELRTALLTMVRSLPENDPTAPVRLWVDRAFTITGAGTVVTGTLPDGTVRVGDELELHGPRGPRRVAVRGLQTAGRAVDRVEGAARVALNLRGVDVAEVARGSALVTPRAWMPGREVDVAVDAERLPGQAVLHVGSAGVPVAVRRLGAGHARLRLDRALPWHVGDRVLLRDPGARAVLGGAVVLDVEPAPLDRRGAAARRAEALAAQGVVDARGEIARRTAVRSEVLVALGHRRPGETDGWSVDDAALPGLADHLRKVLEVWTRDHPLDGGLPVEAARQALDLPDVELVPVVARAAGLALSGGRVAAEALPDMVRIGVDAVLADLRTSPFGAPSAERLAELGLGRAELAAAERAGLLLRTGAVVLAPGSDDAALVVLRDLSQPFTVGEATRALGTSRRVAVPVLELLDRQRRTRRHPDGRRTVIGDAAQSA